MYLLAVGIILLVMKYLEIGPPAMWSWWVILAPFGLTAIWWTWADFSGYSKRKAMAREDARKQARIVKQREQLGLGPKNSGKR